MPMSHLRRVLLLFPLLLLCTSSSPAQTAEVPTYLHANELRDLCRAYTTSVDTHANVSCTDVGQCLGYMQGAVDGLNLAMVKYNIALGACVPKMANPDELTRVTLKVIDEHPEKLSHIATETVWQAMAAYYPCRAK